MKRGFLSKVWIFCTPLPVLRTHLRVKKTQDSYEKHKVWINSIVYRMKKPTTKVYSCKRIMFLQSMNYHCLTRSEV